MDISTALTVGREALWIASLLAGPLLLVILVIGVLIGVVQAATSVQEMTLSFVPKLIFLVLAIVLIGNWQIVTFIDYFERLVQLIPELMR
ncbi:MAG: flagellar biosynthesis protein FliQ [Pseudohongiellaceae bacterium]|jgi:flagellar biosynthetic protein FliQ